MLCKFFQEVIKQHNSFVSLYTYLHSSSQYIYKNSNLLTHVACFEELASITVSVYRAFGQRNLQRTIDFCPDQLGRIGVRQSKIVARVLLSWSIYFSLAVTHLNRELFWLAGNFWAKAKIYLISQCQKFFSKAPLFKWIIELENWTK